MEFFETVKSRYSYRKKLDPSTPSDEDLRKIVQAGLDAPSGKNAQTTGFIIIRDPETVSKINAMPGGSTAMSTAPAFIAAHVSCAPEKIFLDYDFEIEDCAAAVAYILLAAADLGYASVWVDGWLRTDNRAADISRMCGLGHDRVVRIIIPIGRPLEKHPRCEKMSFDERVRII
ncbi:MAG: nitroreductase family protein [Spirochaetales bacterium]|uniref:Nitroreductase family protein n=1 Tax=Candidatus Thalassospirochaeta sargassi TaxID=3119039 RepID=A0AAJ1IA43_9SPIO|nr:nitroreductase family protein [Spirochaetales bacterium]